MTRLWQPSIPITVLLVDNQPKQVTWEGRRWRVAHPVLHWRQRIWWRGIWRDYYKLVVRSGGTEALIVIYHDLLDGQWYLQEVYD